MEFQDWKYKRRDEGWKRVFAFIPVSVGYKGEVAWLQFVEERLDGWYPSVTGFGYTLQWSYRLKEGSPEISKR